MAQFDVYQNKNTKINRKIPYLLDVQVNNLEKLATRVVVPLILASKFDEPIKTLHPQFIIENKNLVMSTAEIAGISVRMLGAKVISLHQQRYEIIAALDFLISGF